jgi:hypothetical protein
MKFGEKYFPKGTFSGQQSDGVYIDRTLAENYKILVESLEKDIQPCIICSGDNQSGTGKTTFLTILGCYHTCLVNEIYKKNNTFTNANIFQEIDPLLDAAPNIAKEQPYSFLVLDEPDDLTIHQQKQRAHDLKKVFRKLRQLNLTIALTSHSFFELPKFYSLQRSQFLVNVRFENRFERGFFKFYGPKAKKLLYIRGRKEWDYDIYPADFEGRFTGNYCFFPNCAEETEKYKAAKYKDMMDDLEDRKKKPLFSEQEIKIKLFKQVYQVLKDEISITKLSEAFGVHRHTGSEWIHKNEFLEDRQADGNYTNNIKKEENFSEEDLKGGELLE